jgi:hypothetical protein
MTRGMAAVFALVFLFALASTTLFLKGLAEANFGTIMAGFTFLALSGGVFLALLRMSKRWEGDYSTKH